MSNGIYNIPTPTNEPGNTYAPGTKERETLKAELERQAGIEVEIPVIINGEKIKTDTVKQVVMPHDHKHVLATYSQAGEKELQRCSRSGNGCERIMVQYAMATQSIHLPESG